ncbi:MAG TPA: hypothetical protein VHV78_18075, partial [Gemmatimonadaceae bacterium]|nr:hypothetical protein [Gemmatimonadaceae bacterium]
MTDAPREPSARAFAAFLSGECSPSETADVLRWARSSPEHAAQLEALRAAWHRDGELPPLGVPTWSADDIWNAIAPRLDDAPPALHLVPNRPRRTPAVGIARRRNAAAWATAVACGVLLVGVWADQR